MAADSATAEKLDSNLVSRKAAAGNKLSETETKSDGTVREEAQTKIEKLQETIEQIKTASQSLNTAKPSIFTPTANVNAVPEAPRVTAFVRPPVASAPAQSVPPAGATIRPKTVQSPQPQQPRTSVPPAGAARPRPAGPMPRRPMPNAQQRAQQQQPAANMPVPMSDVQRWHNYRSPKMNMPAWQKYLPDIGITATCAWMTGAVLYLGGIVGWDNVANMPAHHLGSVIAGVAAPLALMWMGIHYARRDRDIKEQMAPLLHQLDQLMNPNKQIESRIDAVADGLRRQANELINAANQVEKTLGNVRDGLRSDMEKMMEYAGLTGKHLEQASLSMSNRTSHLARLTEQMHGRLASFEEHAKSGSERIDQSVTDMMTKAQGATDKLERQSNNIIAALHAANMRMTRTADDLDSRIGQVANFADQTAARFGDVAAEFGRQGAIVDAATNTMEVQMLRMHDMLSGQMSEMAQSVGAFAGIGRDLSGAVTNFRTLAEQMVGAAVTQINGYTDMMDQRLAQVSAMLDRAAAVTMTNVGNASQDISEQLQAMQTSLRDAAAEAPRMVQAILDETTRRLGEMDHSFMQSGGRVTSQLSDLERHIGTRLEAMSGLATRMTDGASEAIKESLAHVFTQLEDLKNQFTDRASGTQRDLKTFHNDLAQTIEALAHVARRSTDRTVERIMSLNAGISQRIMDLRDTADMAHAQGQQLEGTMAQHIGMMREANNNMGQQAEQMQQQAARMQMSGAMMANDLRDATGQAMALAEVISHIISREADQLRDATYASVDKMDEATTAVETSRKALTDTIATSAQQIAQMTRDLNGQRTALQYSQSSSAESHAALYNEIMRLRDATTVLNNQISSTLTSTDTRTQELRALASRLDDVTAKMQSSIRVSELSLSNSAELMMQASSEARDMMVHSGLELMEASTLMTRELRDAATYAMTQAEVLSHVITREADSLYQAATASTQTLDNAAAAVETSRAGLYRGVMMAAEQVLTVIQDMEKQRAQLAQASYMSADTHYALNRETAQLRDAITALNAQVNNTAISTDQRASELRDLTTRLGEVAAGMQFSMQVGEMSLSNSAELVAQMSAEANEAMSRSSQEMVAVSTRMADQLRESANYAMAQAEILSHVITREADSLQWATAESARTLDGATAAMEASRSELYASVMQSAEEINKSLQQMDYQRNQMDQTRGATTDSYAALYRETAELLKAIEGLNAQVGDTMIASDTRAEELRSLTTRLGEVTIGMRAVLQSGQYSLADSAEMVAQVTTTARDVMVASSSEIAERSAQIAKNTTEITRAFEAQQDAIERNATTGAEAISGMVQQLENTAAAVSMVTEVSARDLDWLCGNIQAAGEAVDRMGMRAQDAMQRARETLTLSEASLQRSASSARINLSELAQRYSDESGRMVGTQDALQQAYDSAISRLERLGQELAGQSFHTFDSMNEMGMLFDARIAQLREGSSAASDQLQRVATELQQNYNSLTINTEYAAKQLAEIQSSLSAAQGDVTLTADHANQQVDAVRKKLGIYAQDLMMMVSQATGQIEAAAANFNDRATAMKDVANENAGQLGDMGARVRMEIDQLAKTVKEATSDQAGSLSTAVERLRQQAEELARQSQQSMVELERQGIRTTENMQQINRNAEEASARLRETSQQLMRQTENIAIAGTDVSKRISQATQQMQMQTQAIKTSTDKAVAAMNESGEELTSKVGEWQASATKTQAQVRKMLDEIATQMAALDLTTTKAEESAKRVTQADTRLKRDAFLNSAKFIIESLNSLSIDLTRVLDPQEADRVWKEFAKGDASAFTRRFLQMREEVPIQRLKEKYERDSEFRNYAMRYFRQFEELFEQALNNDHNDLLATTLTTSDVGKLYSYLAGALGHTQLKVAGSKAA